MLSKIKQLFTKKAEQSDQEKVAEEHLATAALLIEVMVMVIWMIKSCNRLALPYALFLSFQWIRSMN